MKGSIETSLTQSGFKIKNAQGNVVMDKFECEVTIENWGNDTYQNKIVAISLSTVISANVETLEQNVEIKDDEKKTLTFAFY